MLIPCSGHQAQQLNWHRKATYLYTVPRHNLSKAAQGVHGWRWRGAFAMCLGSQRKAVWGRPSMDHHEFHLPLPLIPSPERFLGSMTLILISPVTVRKDAASQMRSWVSWGRFLPLELLFRRCAWKSRLQINMVRDVQFGGTAEAEWWTGVSLNSRQLASGCHNANYSLELLH